MRVAIHRNDNILKHSTNWSYPWEDYCKKNNIDYDIVNCYESDILKNLSKYDCLLWHFYNYALQDILFARSILNSAKNMGLNVFPNFNTSWHFDDKIAETYLLQSANAPIPKTWMFYTLKDCEMWLKTDCMYPIVAKLRCGSGSSNVKLLQNRNEAIAYGRKMFSSGFKTEPSLIYKSKSQLKSSKDWETIVKRFKRIPDLIQTLKNAKKFPKEKGYMFLQEFIPNDGFDLKIVVICDKLSFIVRNVRTGDFRASGGGDLYFDKTLVTKDIIKSAFQISDKFGFQCMGYDYVVDKRDGKGKIVEISYGFSHSALLQAGGYWDRDGVWHNEALNAPNDVIERLIAE
jgi:glutathione synthase/RimK-type ligase-like ATP-grasp enzyme